MRDSLLQCDGNRRVRHSVKVIHRAVNRVHHPAVFGGHVAGIALLAEQRDFGKRGAQDFFDKLLAADIEFQLDVVRVVELDALGLEPVVEHDFAGGACCLDGDFLCGL